MIRLYIRVLEITRRNNELWTLIHYTIPASVLSSRFGQCSCTCVCSIQTYLDLLTIRFNVHILYRFILVVEFTMLSRDHACIPMLFRWALQLLCLLLRT